MKITKYKDIPKYTTEGSWECDYPMHRLVKYIKELEQIEGLQKV